MSNQDEVEIITGATGHAEALEWKTLRICTFSEWDNPEWMQAVAKAFVAAFPFAARPLPAGLRFVPDERGGHMEDDNGRTWRALAPPEPKAETEPMVFCGAVEPGHDGEHRRTPRCWYPHKAGEASPADWVNIPRAAPPPAETAGQKEGL